MVHITSICIGIYLENCKIQVYKIGNNIATFGTGKEMIFFTVQTYDKSSQNV
jgi:hypothetical protein